MSNDVFSASETEFLSFATTFNAGTTTHATLLGIPATLVTGNTAKLAAYPLPKPPTRAKSTAKTARKSVRI